MEVSQGTPLFALISINVVVLTFLVGQYNIEERLERTEFRDKYEEYINKIRCSLLISLISLIPFAISVVGTHTAIFSTHITQIFDIITAALFAVSLLILAVSTFFSIEGILEITHE